MKTTPWSNHARRRDSRGYCPFWYQPLFRFPGRRYTMSPSPPRNPLATSEKNKSSTSSAKAQTLATKPVANAKKRVRHRKKPKEERKSNKGWAEGKREELFRLLLPAFVKARKEGWKEEAEKLMDIQNCYHNHFPYPMKDSDEPNTITFDTKATNPPVPPSLGPDESKARLAYIADYNKVSDFLRVLRNSV